MSLVPLALAGVVGEIRKRCGFGLAGTDVVEAPSPRLQARARRDRIEAPGCALSVWAGPELAQDQVPRVRAAATGSDGAKQMTLGRLPVEGGQGLQCTQG
jgi:hypothetical protein